MALEKLETFHDKLVEMLVTPRYSDYKIGQYFNSLNHISWLSVLDSYTNFRIAEVIFVERFSPRDNYGDSLIVIDYVNSDSHRHDDVDDALFYMRNILEVASKRKAEKERIEANEKQCEPEPTPDSPIPIRADEIKLGTINPTKFYLITGRGNGKTLFYQNMLKNLFGLKIKDVIFNDPATIVFWADGEKTVVQCQNGEEFDPEKGLAMAISKKIFGNKHSYYDVFKKWVGKYLKEKLKKALDEAMKITPDEIIRDGHRYVLADHIVEATSKEENNNET